MYTFTGKLIDSNGNILDQYDFLAKSVIGAKEKISRKHPQIKGTWHRQDGFTYLKISSIGTIHLLIPGQLSKTER